jgi:hypothetical protein
MERSHPPMTHILKGTFLSLRAELVGRLRGGARTVGDLLRRKIGTSCAGSAVLLVDAMVNACLRCSFAFVKSVIVDVFGNRSTGQLVRFLSQCAVHGCVAGLVLGAICAVSLPRGRLTRRRRPRTKSKLPLPSALLETWLIPVVDPKCSYDSRSNHYDISSQSFVREFAFSLHKSHSEISGLICLGLFRHSRWNFERQLESPRLILLRFKW